MNSSKRYRQLFESRHQNFSEYNGMLFVNYSRMVMHNGAASIDNYPGKKKARELMKSLNAVGARFTKGFCPEQQSGYYMVICSEFVPVDKLKKQSLRYEIRRGLKLNTVEKVDAEYVAAHCYETYAEAQARYGNAAENTIDKNSFSENIRSSAAFGDLVHYWVVKHEGKVVGYASNYIHDKEEVNYSTMKFHPSFLRFQISHALVYSMNQFYLEKEGFRYVSDGFMSLVHESGIQQFLERDFGFYKQSLKLQVIFRFPYNLVLTVLYPFRRIVSKKDRRLAALFRLKELSQ